MNDQYTLDDFRKQMAMVSNMALMKNMARFIPDIGQLSNAMNDFDESEMNGLFGIIDSMAPAERANTKIIDQSRRRRIAAGAGCEPHQVNELVRQYEAMAHVITTMDSKGMLERRKLLGEIQGDDEEDTPPDEPLSPVLA